MGANSGIEWCKHTFNPVWGCVKVSPACKHCYAEATARRFSPNLWGLSGERRTFGDKHWSEPLRWNSAAVQAGERHRTFSGSMCDVFEDHPTVTAERQKLWPLIRNTPHLDWLLLTKRPERIAAALPDDWGLGYANVWLMTTIENSDYASRADALRKVPAVVRGISAEPLFDGFDHVDLAGFDWVIGGGESGNGARPMDGAWIRKLRDRCIAADVAFYFKQWGGVRDKRGYDAAVLDGRRWTEIPLAGRVRPMLTPLRDGTQSVVDRSLAVI